MTNNRRIYAAVMEAEPPPLEGTYGDVLMSLKTGVKALEAIRDQHTPDQCIERSFQNQDLDETAAVQNIMQCMIVTMIHCLIKQGAGTGTLEKPVVYN